MIKHKIEAKLIIPADNVRKYSSKKLTTLKKKLATAKSQLDTHFRNKEFIARWKQRNLFCRERDVCAWIGMTFNVTLAWIKCYEMLEEFQLINDQKTITVFDNASFPGSFICSIHHYCYTKRNTQLKWWANSLLEKNVDNYLPLGDKFSLYKNYKENWLMDTEHNGDITDISVQKHIYDKLHNKIDLYTSDLGFDVSQNYNEQERLHVRGNIAQILSGLLVLKKGGSMITKQYTAFEPITLSIMYLLALLFDEVYWCKPLSSKEANSETYLVCKGYHKPLKYNNKYIKILLKKLEQPECKLYIPLFDAKFYPKKFLADMYKFNEVFTERQIKKINLDIEKCTNDEDCAIHKIENIIQWYDDMGIRPINHKHLLNMYDVYQQLYKRPV